MAGRYRLGRPLGKGGRRRVYRAHDQRLDREVAIKVIEEGVDGIEREARSAASLSHAGIVRVFDAGPGFIAMELVEGPSLKEALSERPRLPWREAADIASQVADALDHAHAQGMIHGDVTPRNILLTAEGRVKLVDFGIARAASLSATLTAADIRESAAYLSPEQANGHKPDARSDVYALGAVLFEMLTGRPPFEGKSFAEIIEPRLVADPPPPSALEPSVPADLDAIVLAALRREPDLRLQSAAAAREALARLRQAPRDTDAQTVRIIRRPSARETRDTTGPARASSWKEPSSPAFRPFHWPRPWLVLAAALVILIVVVIVLALRGAGPGRQAH